MCGLLTANHVSEESAHGVFRRRHGGLGDGLKLGWLGRRLHIRPHARLESGSFTYIGLSRRDAVQPYRVETAQKEASFAEFADRLCNEPSYLQEHV